MELGFHEGRIQKANSTRLIADDDGVYVHATGGSAARVHGDTPAVGGLGE
jgi:hypothetical protein